VRLLLLAPPGAGKGTQGERLAAWAGARHIAAGDLLRAEAQAGGALGREIAGHQARGDLVPDQIVLDVLTRPSSRQPGAAGTSWTASRGPCRRLPPRPNSRPGSA
jgi:adenylate kinase